MRLPIASLLERVSEALGVAVRASRDRTRLEDLLAETQRQAEELQTQQEELRVSNEELEVADEGAERNARCGSRASRRSSNRRTRSSKNTPSCSSIRKTRSRRPQAVLSEKAAELERSNLYRASSSPT